MLHNHATSIPVILTKTWIDKTRQVIDDWLTDG